MGPIGEMLLTCTWAWMTCTASTPTAPPAIGLLNIWSSSVSYMLYWVYVGTRVQTARGFAGFVATQYSEAGSMYSVVRRLVCPAGTWIVCWRSGRRVKSSSFDFA